MDNDRALNTFINRKFVYACLGLRTFLRNVLDLHHIVVWSSKALDNMNPSLGSYL